MTPPKRIIIKLPERTCPVCKRKFPVTAKNYITCCYLCHLAYQAQLAEIEKADSDPQEQPF